MVPNLKTCLFLAALAATQTAQACVHITAHATAGLSGSTTIEIEDDGKKICKSVNNDGAVSSDVKGCGMKWSRIGLYKDISVKYKSSHGTYNLKVQDPTEEEVSEINTLLSTNSLYNP